MLTISILHKICIIQYLNLTNKPFTNIFYGRIIEYLALICLITAYKQNPYNKRYQTALFKNKHHRVHNRLTT